MTRVRYKQIVGASRLYDYQEAMRTGRCDKKSPNYDPNYKASMGIQLLTIAAQKYSPIPRIGVIDEMQIKFLVSFIYLSKNLHCTLPVSWYNYIFACKCIYRGPTFSA